MRVRPRESSRELSLFFFNRRVLDFWPSRRIAKRVDDKRQLCQAKASPAEHSKCREFVEGEPMKTRFATLVAAMLFSAALTIAADGTWTGYISDSTCGAK